MQIIIEEIDNMYYADVVLTPNDLSKMQQAEMVTSEVIFKHRKCYVGIRLQGSWDYDEEIKRPKKGLESDEGMEGWRAPQRVKGRPRRAAPSVVSCSLSFRSRSFQKQKGLTYVSFKNKKLP